MGRALSLLAPAAAAAFLQVSAQGSFNYSSRVFPGSDGRLIYTSDNEGNRIPDFSHAGYRGGGVNLPHVPTVVAVGPVKNDNTARLQAAIDAIERWPLDKSGFRGALTLLPGKYKIFGSVFIRSSGVVLRGSGYGTNPLKDTILRRVGNSTADIIQVGIGTDHGFDKIVTTTKQNITTEQVLVGDRSFDVEKAEGFHVGDHIIVYHPCTLAWLAAVDGGGTGSDRPWQQDSQPLVFSRVITEINGNRITIDAPIFNKLDRSLSQSYIALTDRSSILEEVGIENLRVVVKTDGQGSENHARSAIVFTETENCWVRQVVTKRFVYSGVFFRTSTRCTVEKVKAVNPHSLVKGGRRYNFCVEHSQLILFDRCYAKEARHAFVGNGASRDNGIVFLNCTGLGSYASSEPHRRWGMGFLYDGLIEKHMHYSGKTLLALGNRGSYGTGHGWAAAHSVAWNCNVGDGKVKVEKPPTSQNYAIGCSGKYVSGRGTFDHPEGFIELTGSNNMYPQSLYHQQLLDRIAT